MTNLDRLMQAFVVDIEREPGCYIDLVMEKYKIPGTAPDCSPCSCLECFIKWLCKDAKED